MLALLVTAVLGSACGDDSTSESASTTTTTTPTITTATGSPASANCTPDTTASSPATFDGDRGQYATYLTAVEGRQATFDVIQWLSGEDAEKAYAEDNPDDDGGGPPNDYHIRNDSQQTRTAAIADGATVRLVRLAEDSDADLDQGTVEELPAYLQQAGETATFWLTFDDETITDVCEQYQP